ncbi:MAG: YqaJ viral recombinase family protein [Bacillota bacterium]|nr:YqaJ viral recombinase family protein [Bacillota bacterium]
MTDSKAAKPDTGERFTRKVLPSRDHWLEERRKGIGGSDAAAILGLSPWKSNTQLWEEKTGLREPDQPSNLEAIEYGNRAEGSLRQLFKLDFPEFKVRYRNHQILQSNIAPWMQASLDGELTDRDGRQGILEIKTTRIASSMQSESWAGQVPQTYYCQLLHYLLVTGYDFAVLVAQLKYDYGANRPMKKTTRHYHFEAKDLEADMRHLLAAEVRFWQQVESRTRPAQILPSI